MNKTHSVLKPWYYILNNYLVCYKLQLKKYKSNSVSVYASYIVKRFWWLIKYNKLCSLSKNIVNII